MDVELAAQTATLLAGSPARRLPDQIAAGVAGGILTVADGAALTRAAAFFWQLQAAARLLTGGRLDPAALGAGGLAFVLRETGQADVAALADEIAAVAQGAAQVVDRLLAAGG
jgi:glutamate-ammonia-ligase adenylyltransferase